MAPIRVNLPAERMRSNFKETLSVCYLRSPTSLSLSLPFPSASRYATTLVTSEVHNPEAGAREIFLTVILPDTAFISRFAIEVSGQLFVAFVKEKEEAWRQYQSAVEKGHTAGE